MLDCWTNVFCFCKHMFFYFVFSFLIAGPRRGRCVAVGCEQRAASSEQRAASSEQRAESSEQRSASSEQRAARTNKLRLCIEVGSPNGSPETVWEIKTVFFTYKKRRFCKELLFCSDDLHILWFGGLRGTQWKQASTKHAPEVPGCIPRGEQT